MRLAVETPKGVARLAAASREEPASFRVQVRSDSSAVLAVFRGAADVSVGERTVRVEANQAVELDPAGSAAPHPLAAPPVPAGPAPGARVAFRGPAPEVRFRWTRPAGSDSVRFVVARDPDLAEVVLDVVTTEDEVSVRTLAPGKYSWSVAAIRNGGAGAWAPASAIALLRDEEAPPLHVEWPEGVVREKTCRLSGTTEPGAHVFAGDAPTRSGPDGRFEIEVELTRGANNVVVEAVDDAGNSAYQSWMIKAQY
jgi:hypothetical protein